MDKIIDEVMLTCGINYNIESKEIVTKSTVFTLVPRWDVYLLKPILNDYSSPYSHIINLLQQLEKYKELKAAMEKTDLRSNVHAVKQFLLSKFAIRPTCSSTLIKNHVLVLERSESPAFYQPNGGAEISGYGVTRRKICNTASIVTEFKNAGVSSVLYEPGIHNLMSQIKSYSTCSGLIGIKGAEFANLIWLEPGTKVLQVKPVGMNTPPIQRLLAQLMDLTFFEIEMDNQFGDVDFQSLTKFFGQ